MYLRELFVFDKTMIGLTVYFVLKQV